MSFSSGSIITASDYNSIQSRISRLLGVGDGTYGYGQFVSSSLVQANNTIIEDLHFANLKSDIIKIANHQSNTASTLINSLPTITAGQTVNAAHFNAFEAVLGTLESQRFDLAPGQYSDEFFSPSISQSRSTVWGNGAAATLIHSFTVDFGSADNARHFFNSGGSIRLSPALDLNAPPQTYSWKALFQSMGTVIFNHTTCTSDGSIPGTTSNIGFYDLTSTSQQVFTKSDTASYAYSTNDYTITVRSDVANNTNGGARLLYFSVFFRDDYYIRGTWGVDQVQGTLNHVISLRRATGSNVDVVKPTAFNTNTIGSTIISDEPYPNPVVSNFYRPDSYFVYSPSAGPHVWTMPNGATTSTDTLMLIFMGDKDHSDPIVTSPISDQSLSYNATSEASGTAAGSALSVHRVNSATNRPTINFSTPENNARGILYAAALPARFRNANFQVMGVDSYNGTIVPPDNSNSITFTAPFNGYYFCVQFQDVSGSDPIPGTTVPGDQSYGIGFNASTGSWSSPGPMVYPRDATNTTGGMVQRVDWAYLTAGTTVTTNYRKLANTRRTNGNTSSLLMHVIAFQTEE